MLLETFRPGTLARLGIPPEELRERFPRLVIRSLSGALRYRCTSSVSRAKQCSPAGWCQKVAWRRQG